MVMNSCKG